MGGGYFGQCSNLYINGMHTRTSDKRDQNYMMHSLLNMGDECVLLKKGVGRLLILVSNTNILQPCSREFVLVGGKKM